MKKLKRRLAWSQDRKTLLYCIWTVPETNSCGQHYANWRSRDNVVGEEHHYPQCSCENDMASH